MTDLLDELVALIKRFEGCRLNAYQCPAGIWTIGWGETAGIKPGMVWTQAQADAVLQKRVAQFLVAVLKRCPALSVATPNRAAACTSLAYNIGVGAFAASSVRRMTMRGDYAAAAQAFLLWNKAGGRELRGLTYRRVAERSVYLRDGLLQGGVGQAAHGAGG